MIFEIFKNRSLFLAQVKSIWVVPNSLLPTQACSSRLSSLLRPQWPQIAEGRGVGEPSLEATHITSTHVLTHDHLSQSLGNSRYPRGRGRRLGPNFNYIGGGGEENL